MSVVRLTRALYDAIRVHGEETYPNECCGVLLGYAMSDGSKVVAAVRTRNTRAGSARDSYAFDPAELAKVMRHALGRGMDIAGFYHSHPDHPAQWSPTDFAEAHWLGCSYVITTVAEGKATVTNSFLLTGSCEEEKSFQQETILLED